MCSSGPIDERSVRFVVVAFGQFVRIISIFNLATSRSYFEDYMYIFGAEVRLFYDFIFKKSDAYFVKIFEISIEFDYNNASFPMWEYTSIRTHSPPFWRGG